MATPGTLNITLYYNASHGLVIQFKDSDGADFDISSYTDFLMRLYPVSSRSQIGSDIELTRTGSQLDHTFSVADIQGYPSNMRHEILFKNGADVYPVLRGDLKVTDVLKDDTISTSAEVTLTDDVNVVTVSDVVLTNVETAFSNATDQEFTDTDYVVGQDSSGNLIKDTWAGVKAAIQAVISGLSDTESQTEITFLDGTEKVPAQQTDSSVVYFDSLVLDNVSAIIEVKTDNPGSTNDDQFKIQTTISPRYTVEWGDGTIDRGVEGDITHTYASAGTYIIKIRGTFYFQMFGSGDEAKLLSVKKWGDIQYQSFSSSFRGCSNLNIEASDPPDLSGVTTLANMLRDSNLTTANGLPDWDTSNITDMGRTFQGCENFNADIGSWDTSSVSSFTATFFGATSFDQDISGWDVTSVTSLAAFLGGGAGLSTVNYDALLVGWEGQAVQNNVSADFGTSTYSSGSAAATARQALIDDHNWSITDGGAV